MSLNVCGGIAFGYSAWRRSELLGSWTGGKRSANYTNTFTFGTAWEAGADYVITGLQDHLGYDMSWTAGTQLFKAPLGIYSYDFSDSNGSVVEPATFSWKVQGNLGGGDYVDITWGPFNEGGLYGERQGWHLPDYPDEGREDITPFQGTSEAGVTFYRTTFAVDIPSGIDYRISINSWAIMAADSSRPFRALLFVNGWQFGRYVSSLGPQTKFPIPPVILNGKGENALVVAIWTQTREGAAIESLSLEIDERIEYRGPAFGIEEAPGYDVDTRKDAT